MRVDYLEKRSAMALFFPLGLTMDSSLAVTLSDWDAHCLRLNGAMEAMFVVTSECVLSGRFPGEHT